MNAVRTCPRCGFQWQAGTNCAHSCISKLLADIEGLKFDMAEDKQDKQVLLATVLGIRILSKSICEHATREDAIERLNAINRTVSKQLDKIGNYR